MKAFVFCFVLSISGTVYAHDIDCTADPDPGLCEAYMPRYYFNVLEGRCRKFIYGGCGGNTNNFDTEEECYSKCKDVFESEVTFDICELPFETGVCDALFYRYGFDKSSGECKEFVYGGCGGNENNFMTKKACESACKT